jgi:hypothetical protein
MELKFKNFRGEFFSPNHEYIDDCEAFRIFFLSLGYGEIFLTEVCKLIIKSVSRVNVGNNGLMEFVALAKFHNGGSGEVKGLINFQFP